MNANMGVPFDHWVGGLHQRLVYSWKFYKAPEWPYFLYSLCPEAPGQVYLFKIKHVTNTKLTIFLVTTNQEKILPAFWGYSYGNRPKVNHIRPAITWVITCLGCAMFLRFTDLYRAICMYYNQNTGQLWARASAWSQS